MLSVSIGSNDLTAPAIESGSAAEATSLSVEADLPAPVAPNWISLEAIGPTQVQLEWSDVEGENGYDVYVFSHPTIGPVLPGESRFSVTPTFVLSFLASVGA